MVSRITGSVGKGLAAITMDKEYQQKRREEMNRPPRDFGQSLAKGGKGLLKVRDSGSMSQKVVLMSQKVVTISKKVVTISKKVVTIKRR